MKRFAIVALTAWSLLVQPAFGQHASPSASQPASQPTALPASQPTALPASQPTALPAGEHTGHTHAANDQTLYTCSMHPQILQDDPGSCPVCGMDLVAKSIKAEPKAASGATTSKQRKILYWVAPMDAAFRSDQPGKSPMGMDLVPVYQGGSGSTVAIDPIVVQNMGVRTARVQRGTLSRAIRTIGTVQVAEDRQSVVNLRYSGWIERIRVDETGVKVTKGQALFDVYSPELVSAQQEYLIALRTGGKTTPLAKSAKRRLELFGASRSLIRRIEKDGAVGRITVRAPRAGHVVHLNVVQGARVQAGKDLYRIADLSEVWIEAEVYEHDSPWLSLGAAASVTLSFQEGKPRTAKVDYIYPTLNPRTRTLRVRLVLANTELSLRPGAFATVEIDAQQQADALLVPTEAIIHSGTRQIVFVALAAGTFEAREIQTGLVGNRSVTQVNAGLVEGERVVTSGQFLLDSESQLQEAVQKMLRDRLAASKAFAPLAESGQGEAQADGTYWTCSMHPQVVQDDPGTCPICGMDLVEKQR